MKKITSKQRTIRDKHYAVKQLYKSGQYTTEYIAKLYNISTRQVQRIARIEGVIRTQAEANRVAAPLKHYHKVPNELKIKRKHLTRKLRYKLISEHPYCATCGLSVKDGIRLEVDHINENPHDNDLKNLQVLCNMCSQGKYHFNR